MICGVWVVGSGGPSPALLPRRPMSGEPFQAIAAHALRAAHPHQGRPLAGASAALLGLCKVSALCAPAGQARPPTLNSKCALPSLSLHQVGEPMYEDRTAFPRRLIEVVGSVPSPSCALPLLGPLRELLLLFGGVAAGAAVVAGAWQRNRRKMKV